MSDMHKFNLILFSQITIKQHVSHPKLVSVLKQSFLTMRGVDTQVDGHRGDALVGCNAISLCLDLLPDLIKICELFALTVKEFSIF